MRDTPERLRVRPSAWLAFWVYPAAERIEGRRVREKLARLRAEEAAPPAVRRQRQHERLVEALRHAGACVPYYRDLFARKGFDPERVAADPAWLQELPTLDKETLRAEAPRLVSDDADPAALHRRRTGASTGPAATVLYGDEDLDWTAAASLRVREWAGAPRTGCEVHVSTEPGVPVPLRDRIREAVKCASLNRRNVRIEGLDPARLDALWHALRRARPDLVQAHPSTLHALALHVRRRGGAARPLARLWESTGEELASRREAIESALGGRLLDRYGSAEFGVVAVERPGSGRPGLHVLDALVWAETLPAADGDAVPELVVTALRNRAMPLLRYRTGDRARLARDDGEVGGRILALHGRVHDTVPIAGRPVPTHVLQDRLDRLGCVEEFQVELRAQRAPLLRVAVEAGGDARDRTRRHVHAWWGEGLELAFVPRSAFVRTARGKLRYVVEDGQVGARPHAAPPAAP